MSESLIGYILSCLQVWFGPRVTFSEEKITICLTTKIIGEGSYSNVIKAIDINNFRKYAVKKILVQSTDAEQNIHNEIEALSRFKHSNILPCIAHKYSVDMKKGMKVVYLVFPFVRQGNLRQILNSTLKNEIKPLGIRYILRYFYDIASAISVLHASSPSYVHNDIKPENILVEDDGKPLLTDFGSVRRAEIHIISRNDSLRVAEEAAQFCTPQYRAPELYDPPVGSTLDTRSDVWSLGCLLYAWYYGFSPYEISFDKHGMAVSSECSYLRILSGVIPRPPHISLTSAEERILDLVNSILVQDFRCRPFIDQLLQKVEHTIQLDAGERNNDIFPSQSTV